MYEIKKLLDIRDKYNNKSIRYFVKRSYGINYLMVNIIFNMSKINSLYKFKISDLSDYELNIIVNNIIKMLNLYNNKLNIIVNINNMRKIKTYKYLRHFMNLPVNGQRTHTNRKTKRKFFQFINNSVNKHIFKI